GWQGGDREERRLLPHGAPVVWIEVTLSILRDRAGLPRRGICIARDISERKRAEAAQKLLHEASELLMGSLDGEGALERGARFALPRPAALCLVQLPPPREPPPVPPASRTG